MNVNYPKIFKSWSTNCLNLPRWLDTNSFDSTFFDDLPVRLGYSSSLTTLFSYPSNTVSSSQVLPTYLYTKDTNNLRIYSDLVDTQKSSLRINSERTFNKSFTNLDQSNCPIIFYAKLESSDIITTFTLNLSTGTADIPRVNTLSELWETPTWAYYQEEDFVILYGLDITEYTTVIDANNWHYLPYSNIWDGTSNYWLLNPQNNLWYYYPLESIQSNYIPLNYNGTTKIRIRHQSKVNSLTTLDSTIDGTDYALTRKVLWNDVDDKLALHQIKRRFDENNYNLVETFFTLNNFSGSTKNKFKNTLSAHLRTGTNILLSGNVSSYTLPNSLHEVTVKNFNKTNFQYDKFYKGTEFYSNFFNLTNDDEVFVYNLHKKPPILNNNQINFFQDTISDTALVFARHKVTNYTQIGDQLNFSFKNKPATIVIYQPAKVDIVDNMKPRITKIFWTTTNLKAGQATFV